VWEKSSDSKELERTIWAFGGWRAARISWGDGGVVEGKARDPEYRGGSTKRPEDVEVTSSGVEAGSERDPEGTASRLVCLATNGEIEV
jgi:hypothetical protein